jgi:hypothetical protein
VQVTIGGSVDKNTSIINYISEKISISYYVLVDLESRELQDFTSREIACLSRRSSSSLQYKRNQVLDTCDTLSQTCLFLGANNEPSKDQQGEFSAMLHTNHHWQINSPKDLKEQVATELGPWVRILQEQYPGACAQAMCQKEAQVIVGQGHVSWMMACLLTLIKQKQHQLSHGLLACLHKTAFLEELSFQ